jgi:hypothetical protein
MHRYGITTLSSLKTTLAYLPDDYLIGTNIVGNLSVYKLDKDNSLIQTGVIELANMKFEDSYLFDCEYDNWEKWSYL